MRIITKDKHGNEFPLDIDSNSKVEDIMKKISELKGGIPLERIMILNGSRRMDEMKKVADYNLQDGSELLVIFRRDPELNNT